MQPYNIIDNQQQQQLQLSIEGELAFLEYRLKDGVIYLMHTEVPERLGGRGIGTALAAAAFDYAKAHNLKIKVYCPFVKKYLDRHPGLGHLVINPS
jgi:predicted GNAT family acetyltransferase